MGEHTRQTKSENETHDFHDPVCGMCKNGGKLMCCGGKCLRSFHPKCLQLKIVDVDRIVRSGNPLICSDCSLGVQRCFSCRKFGLESELVECNVKFCGKFFHKACLQSISKGSSLCNKSSQSDTKSIICPLHTCGTCGISHTCTEKRSLIWRCFRCPKAFDITHRPRDVHILGPGIFLCIDHTLAEEESWPELSNQLVKRAKLIKKEQAVVIKEKTISETKSVEKKEVKSAIAASVKSNPMNAMLTALLAKPSPPNDTNKSRPQTSTDLQHVNKKRPRSNRGGGERDSPQILNPAPLPHSRETYAVPNTTARMDRDLCYDYRSQRSGEKFDDGVNVSKVRVHKLHCHHNEHGDCAPPTQYQRLNHHQQSSPTCHYQQSQSYHRHHAPVQERQGYLTHTSSVPPPSSATLSSASPSPSRAALK